MVQLVMVGMAGLVVNAKAVELDVSRCKVSGPTIMLIVVMLLIVTLCVKFW